MDNTPLQDANAPTYQDHKSDTTPNPYAHDFGESKLPPPPPKTPSRRIGKIVTGVLYIIVVIAASTFAYIIGFKSGTTIHSQNSSTYSPVSISSGGTPALQHTPTTNNGSGLYSQDFKSFYSAFTQQLMAVNYVPDSSVSLSFELSCDNTTTPPCAYGWSDVYQMLKGKHLIFSYPCDGPGNCPIDGAYTNDSCKNIPYPVRAYTYTVEKYDQDGSINAPTIGEAVLAFFEVAISGNTNQWLWEGVILQSSC